MIETETRLLDAERSVVTRSACCLVARRDVAALIERLQDCPGLDLTAVWIPDDDGWGAGALQAVRPQITVCASFDDFVGAAGRTEVIALSREPGLVDRRLAIAVLGHAIHAAASSAKPVVVCSTMSLLANARSGGPLWQEPEIEDWLISLIDREANGRHLKRAIDLVVASLALVLVAPLMALVALAVRLESSGPALFIQERVGHRGRSFRVIKFRTMCHGAEALDAGVPTMTKLNDNRITRLGRFLRKSRLDELPQLFNVLKGDMALVGPRPFRRYLAEETAKRVPFYRVRYAELPGLTGWAQVAYKYPTSFEEQVKKFEFEFEYIAHRSTRFDLYIMLRTLWVMLCLKGT